MSERTPSQAQKAATSAFTPVSGSFLQRKCSCGQHTIAGSECAECGQKREGTLQRAAVSPALVNVVPTVAHDVLNSPGQALDADTRAFMEPRFGHDFSHVRVHTDEKAAESAYAVGALAYTVGRDVVFAAGQYTPGTMEGKQLLAHELTHTIQQAMITLSNPVQLSLGQSGDELEQQADSVAQAVVKPSPSERKDYTHSVPQISRTAESRLATKANPAAVARLDAKAIRNDPDYIENNLVRMEFYDAEQAVLHYADGANLTIGLVPKWIKPPLETVDYHTARSEFAEVNDSSKELKFIAKPQEVPSKGLTLGEVIERSAQRVRFTVDPGSGKIVPNHLNPVTAPKLSRLLREAEAEYVKHFDELSKGMIKILEKERIILYLALFRAMLGGPKTPARPLSSAAGATSEELIGPAGKLAQAEVEEAIAASGGRTVELYSKLTQAPVAGRAISFATERGLAEAARSAGRIFVVRVPEILFRKMLLIGVIVHSTTMMGGETGTEYRVLSQAAATIIRFLVP